QQVMQAAGVLAAVLVMAPILNLLLQAYGLGAPTPEQPNALLAPQATLMASVAEGVFGAGLPWTMVGIGVLIGAAIIVLDEYLKATQASWRAPVLAVAVGIYLPLELATAILLGGLIAYYSRRRNEASGTDAVVGQRNGMLFASGLITGEALIGIAMAVPIVLSGNPDVIALGIELPAITGLLVIAALGGTLYRVATTSG
ncbi:MAG: OPT/YSL family transporter, partial [Gammaproteobacteria bacterium]